MEDNLAQPSPQVGLAMDGTRESAGKQRVTVDLSEAAARQFEALLLRKHLSRSQAIRQALILLNLASDDRYDLILRDKQDKLPDQRIILT